MKERMTNLFLEFEEIYYNKNAKNAKRFNNVKNFLENTDINLFRIKISVDEILLKKLIELGEKFYINKSSIEEEVESIINKIGYLSNITELWPSYKKSYVSEAKSFKDEKLGDSFIDKMRQIVKNNDSNKLDDKNLNIDDKIEKLTPKHGEYRQDEVIQYYDADLLYTAMHLYPFILSLNVTDVKFEKAKIEKEIGVFEDYDKPIFGKEVNFNINGINKITSYNKWVEKLISEREEQFDNIPTNEDDMKFYDDKPDNEYLVRDVRTPAKDENLLGHFDNIKVSEKFLLDW